MDDIEILMCSECLQPFDPSDNIDRWQTTECLFSEDVYCSDHLLSHNKEYHPLYFRRVMVVYTQMNDKTLIKVISRMKQFKRDGKRLMSGVRWRQQEYGKVPEFDYTLMSHDIFTEKIYPHIVKHDYLPIYTKEIEC